MDVDALLAFALVDLLLVLTPGADWAYALRVGLSRDHVGAAVLGLAAGYAVHGALVAVGVGAVLAQEPGALRLMTAIGAAYVIWLGVSALRARDAPSGIAISVGARPARTVAVQGALISGLNPKGLLLFFAVLPQFVRPSAPWPAAAQLAVLAAVHVLACAGVYTGIALVGRGLLSRRPGAATTLTRVSGTALLVVGAVLAFEAAT